MVKLRQAKYCNLKLFLMFLVVFGHMIEPTGHWLYRAIYTFHMPAFAMLSGLFSQNDRLFVAKKLFLCYIMLQAVAVCLGITSALTPYWHLWYLLSNACWLLMAQAFERFDRWLVLICAVLFACMIGYVPQVGRTLSLSRMLVFFPYFWWGQRFRGDWKKHRVLGCICAFAAVIAMMLFKVPMQFFYQATDYGELEYGGLFRLACYGVGFAFCVFLIAFAPDRRFAFTKAGADTLTVYLFHAPIVLILRRYALSMLASALVSAAILWIFYKIQQGRRYYCGIKEGGRKWPHFRKSMKNMPNRSTDFSSL